MRVKLKNIALLYSIKRKIFYPLRFRFFMLKKICTYCFTMRCVNCAPALVAFNI